MTDLLQRFPAVLRQQCATEAVRLIAALQVSLAVTEARNLMKSYLPATGHAGTQKPTKLANPLVSMLLARPLETVPNHKLLDTLRGWCLVATLRFCAASQETDQHSRPLTGLRTIRRMAAGKFGLDPLSELQGTELDAQSLRQAVFELEQAYRARSHPRLHQIGDLGRLIESAIFVRAPRKVSAHLRRAEADRVPQDQTIERDGVTLTLSAQEAFGPDAALDDIAEAMRIRSYRFAPSDKAFAEARFAAQLDLLEFEDRDLGFGAEFAALTGAEARMIGAKAQRDARAGQRGAGLVLAALVSGRSVEQLAEASRTPALGATWISAQGAICFAPDVRFAGAPERGGFGLHLPLGWDSDVAAARDWLARHRIGRAIPLSRVSRGLPDAMAGQDDALVGLLCGLSVKERVALYYARFPVARLAKIWSAVLRDEFGLSEGFSLQTIDPKTLHIGSLCGPELKAVSAWFQELVARVSHARERLNEGVVALPSVTAAEANLAASVLAFQTGRRPHGPAFEPLGQIVGACRPRVRLTGKGNRQVEDGRWVPMTRASQQAVALWRGSLARLRAQGVLAANRDLGEMVRAVEAGVRSAFFAWDEIGDAPESLTAAELFERVAAPALPRNRGQRAKDVQGAPSNWSRHVMRRELAARGISGEMIDGFMGHGGAAADPLSPLSAASVGAQDALRDTLDAIWADLGVSLPEVSN